MPKNLPTQYVSGTGPYGRLFAAVEALGGQTPASCRAALKTRDAYQDAHMQAAQGYHGPSVWDNVRAAAAEGVALSQEVAHAHLRDAARAKLIQHHGLEMGRELDVKLGQLLHDLIAGDAGEELMGSLRPGVEEAIRGIRACAEHFTSDTTHQQMLDAGPEAIAAYQEARNNHSPLLDRVLDRVLRPMSAPGNDALELIPPHLGSDFGELWLASWVANPAKAHDLHRVANILRSNAVVGYNMPGGRWLAIYQLQGLQLNSPREAVAVLQSLYDEQQAEHYARYASQTAGPDGVPLSSPPRRRPADPRPAAERAQGRMRAGVDPLDTEALPVPGSGDIGYSEDVN
jgi:hypothetical protein